MASMTKDTDGKWLYSNSINSKEGLESVLKTSGKFLSSDIKLDIDVKEGVIESDPEAELEIKNSSTYAGITSLDVGFYREEDLDSIENVETYPVTLNAYGTANITAKGSVDISNSGWIDKQKISLQDKTEDFSTPEKNQTFYIKKGECHVGDYSTSFAASAEPSGFTPSETTTKYSVTASGIGGSSIGIHLVEGYFQEDWISETCENPTFTSDTLYIAEAGLKNSVSEEEKESYPVNDNAPVLISGDYLYIDGGMIDKQKIALSKLVPDGSNVKGKEALMYNSVSAYDNDGVLVAGTMGDASVAFADKEITLTGSLSEDGTTYKISSAATTSSGVVTGGYLAPGTSVNAGIKAAEYTLSVFDGEWE